MTGLSSHRFDSITAKTGEKAKEENIIEIYQVSVPGIYVRWTVAVSQWTTRHHRFHGGSITGSAITLAPLCQLLQNGQFPV